MSRNKKGEKFLQNLLHSYVQVAIGNRGAH